MVVLWCGGGVVRDSLWWYVVVCDGVCCGGVVVYVSCRDWRLGEQDGEGVWLSY